MARAHDPALNARRYQELCERMLSGARVAEEEFLEHFAIQDEGATSGPPVGSTAPEIRAADQHGAARSRRPLWAKGAVARVRALRLLVTVLPEPARGAGTRVRERTGEGVEIAVVAPDSAERVREFAEQLVSLRPDPGPYPVRVRLRYQACSDQSCLRPAAIEAEVEVELLDDVPAASAIRPRLTG